jgi:hypothetical protein
MKTFAAGFLLSILITTSALAQSTEGFGSGLTDRDYPHVGTPLLNAFEFHYGVILPPVKCGDLPDFWVQEDHHLAQILIWPDFSPGRIRIGFQDKNGDAKYFYRLSHHGVSDPRIQQFTRTLDICSEQGKCTVRLDKPKGDFVFVLVGFQLAFHGTDHHIDEVGVLEKDAELTVFFNDKNDDDLFLWSLQFAYVPRDLFGELGVSSGTRERRGASRSISSGNSVIRGFKFNFEPYFTSGGDHHIGHISVCASSGRVDVLYTDKNFDDGFDWEVHWALLR